MLAAAGSGDFVVRITQDGVIFARVDLHFVSDFGILGFVLSAERK